MASSDIFRAPMPTVIYGTARKGTDSGDLVYQAIKAGFRGIDSGVGEHYNEASVGKGLQRAYEDKIIERSDLYVSIGCWYHQPPVHLYLIHLSRTDVAFTDGLFPSPDPDQGIFERSALP